jgi:hypothetical protein
LEDFARSFLQIAATDCDAVRPAFAAFPFAAAAMDETAMAQQARLRKAGMARFDRRLNLRPIPIRLFIVQSSAFQFMALIGHSLNKHYI